MTQQPEDLISDERRDALRASALMLARLAKAEDFGAGDIPAALDGSSSDATFHLVAREPGVLAGKAIADVILGVYSERLKLDFIVDDGDSIEGPFATLSGPADLLVSAERVLLNFLQRQCGVATLTKRYVDAVAGTVAKVYDTRKTTPGWRLLEKYAVLCGGGQNHRMGLYDAVLIKDNHLAGVPVDRLAGHLFGLLNRLEAITQDEHSPFSSPQFVEVEVDTLEQFEALLDVVGIDIVLLDNFSIADLTAAVALRDGRNLRSKLALEASGGITLDTIGEIARTGVDRISVGALTHSAPVLDISLDA